MRIEGLTRDDSSTIGFVVSCYFANAIDTAELRQWAEHVVVFGTEYPRYILDLLEFDEARFHIYRVLGFSPSSEFSKKASDALSGVAYARGREVFDGPPRHVALLALRRCPDIQSRFNSVFPFLEPIQMLE